MLPGMPIHSYWHETALVFCPQVPNTQTHTHTHSCMRCEEADMSILCVSSVSVTFATKQEVRNVLFKFTFLRPRIHRLLWRKSLHCIQRLALLLSSVLPTCFSSTFFTYSSLLHSFLPFHSIPTILSPSFVIFLLPFLLPFYSFFLAVVLLPAFLPLVFALPLL
jgi:hypothetical protein